MSRGADSPTAHARLPPEIGDAVSDVVTVFARLVPRARIARVAAVAACALLPACASLAPADDAASTSPPLPLLSPASLGPSLQADPVLPVASASAAHSLQFVVPHEAQSLSLHKREEDRLGKEG